MELIMYYNKHEMYIDEYIKTTPLENYIDEFIGFNADKFNEGYNIFPSSSSGSSETCSEIDESEK